jgi:hypothetical protein
MEYDTKDEKGFVIKDRRHFDETGEIKTQPPEAGEKKETRGKQEEAPQSEEKAGSTAQREESLPEITFSTFVFSLGTSVMYHFGDFPDPVSKKTEKNMAAAKQTIDILGILKDKTDGNLNTDEKNLLDSLLFELRMRYIKEKEKG